MNTYCISKIPNENGYYEIHKLYHCNDFPFQKDRDDFISRTEEQAIEKAEQRYVKVSRCPLCMADV